MFRFSTSYAAETESEGTTKHAVEEYMALLIHI
jgi:hypothetical protein